jgi:hypothetical protein
MAAVVCARRRFRDDTWACCWACRSRGEEPDADTGSFASDAQRERFGALDNAG